MTEEDLTPKYSIIPKLLQPSQEVHTSDYVCCHDGRGILYLNFFDNEGRLWKGLLDDFIIIHNFPDEDDIKYFAKLKSDVKHNEDKMRNPQIFIDPTIS